MGHHHHHHHGSGNIKVAFFLNLGFTIVEFFGGLYVNSVAIISDALHDLGDSISLGLSWYLDSKSKQKANKSFTFGYRRFSLLGAFINSIVLIIGSVFVINEAVERLLNPESTNAQGMFLFAILGVAVNGYAAWRVGHGKTLNEKVISWHLIEDVLGWAAVLVASVILMFKDVPYLDPALSLFITAYILWNVIKRLKETVYLFLQGAPEDFSIDEINKKLLVQDYIASTHHMHLWSLDGENHVFSTHLILKGVNSYDEVLKVKKKIRELLHPYHFSHCTIEIELDEDSCSIAHSHEGEENHHH